MMENLKGYLYKIFYWLLNQYYRLKNYIFWGEFRRKHFIFQKKGSEFRILVQDHYDFVEDIQKKINKYKHKSNEKKYVKYALEKSLEGCMYIIITKGEKFVQFWTNHGRFDFDFPINKENGNAKYFYQTIGLLATMDFVRDSFVPSQIPTITKIMPYHTYKIEDDGKLKTVSAYFKRMVPEATEVTMKMFKEVYKIKKGKLKIEVG